MFDLSEFVELTELGERWVRRIGDIERAEEEAQALVELEPRERDG